MPFKYSKPVYETRHPSWFWDAAIVAALILLAALHVDGHLAGITWLTVLSGAAFLVIIYGSFIEPRFLTIRRFEIGQGKRAVAIAFLSDFHVGPYKGARWLERLVKKVNGLAPDLVLLGGDYLYDNVSQARLLEPLKGLKGKLGVFGVLGNHDGCYGLEETASEFAKIGIRLFRNGSFRVADGLFVAGVNDDWYDDTDFDAAERGIGPDDAVIMLIHNPDLAPYAARLPLKPKLMLSGHTHGGQIRLPFIGPVPRLPHHLGRKYDRGPFEFNGVPLIIGQGVGESGPRARLFCPPQIVFVTLHF